MADASEGAPSAGVRTDPPLRRELCGPLTVVAGRVQLLRRQLRRGDPDPERMAADLEAVEAAVVRLTALLARLDDGPVGRG